LFYYFFKTGSLTHPDNRCPTFFDVLQVETRALNFKESAQSKVGSMDYVEHKAGGGDKKVGLK